MRRLTVFMSMLFILFAIGRPGHTHAQKTDVRMTVDVLREATLAGDVDALLALYAPDATVVSPFGTFTGRDAIRGFYDGFLAQNPALGVTFADRQTAFFTEVHRSFVSSDFIRAAGLERVVFIETIVAPAGQVMSATILLDLSDPQTAQFAQALGG